MLHSQLASYWMQALGQGESGNLEQVRRTAESMSLSIHALLAATYSVTAIPHKPRQD
jgi:hypothetical protein